MRALRSLDEDCTEEEVRKGELTPPESEGRQGGQYLLYQPSRTEHAVLRMAQRHLSYDEVQYVVRHGKQYYCAGILHFYLGTKDIPAADRRFSRYSRLEGTAVLLDSRGGTEIITVYRNRRKDAQKVIRRKAKYDKRRAGRRRVA
jgi:hypothetical protein